MKTFENSRGCMSAHRKAWNIILTGPYTSSITSFNLDLAFHILEISLLPVQPLERNKYTSTNIAVPNLLVFSEANHVRRHALMCLHASRINTRHVTPVIAPPCTFPMLSACKNITESETEQTGVAVCFQQLAAHSRGPMTKSYGLQQKLQSTC